MKRFCILLALTLMTSLALADGKGGVYISDDESLVFDFPSRGYLGVTITTVENIDEGSEDNGVYISRVRHGSGAEAAGLKAKDRIVSINGHRIENLEDLEEQLKISQPGDAVEVVVLRGRREEGFQVVLDAGSVFELKRNAFELDRGKYLLEFQERGPRLGVHSQTLSPQLAEFFEVDHGVLLTNVAEGSAAQQAGLRAGDIVLEVNGHKISGTQDIFPALAGQEAGQTVEVTLQSRGRLEVVTVTLDEAMDKQKMAAFNVMLKKESASGTLELDMGASGSWTLELERPDDNPEAIRLKIRKLEQELERLSKQLERQGND